MARISLFLIVLAVLICPFVKGLHAEEKKGKLDSFEETLDTADTAGRKGSDDNGTSSTLSSGSVEGDIIASLLGVFMTSLFDMAEEKDLKGVHRYLRKHDIPALPTFRLEGDYQYLAGGMYSFDGRMEAGYLMFGLDGEYKRYWEKDPSDTMNLADYHVLIRALFGEVFQINLALGQKFIWGSRTHQGFDVGFPFYFIFGKNFIWDVRPYLAFVGGRRIYDVSTGLNLKYKFAGVRAGYRILGAGGQKLQGPAIGLFVQF